MADSSYIEQIDKFKAEVGSLGDIFSEELIEETAVRLEGLNYTPPVVPPLQQFMRMGKKDLLAEIDRIVALDDAEACALAPDNKEKCEDLRVQYITVLIFYYKKLLALRAGDSEEWDEVDELYVHD